MKAFLVDEVRRAALRALNYSPALERIRQTGSDTSTPLRTLLASYGDSYWSVFTRRDCAPEHGVELFSQTDMFAAEPSGRVIRRDSMPAPDLHRVSRWQVLIAGAGQMAEGNLFGRSILADRRLEGGYLGPHAVALTFHEPGGAINLWTYAFLNTSIGVNAIKTAAFGTSVPGLRLDLLADLPVPIADQSTMDRVAILLRRCAFDRERFLTLLRQARSLVETLPAMAEAHAMCADRSRRALFWEGPLPTLCAWNAVSTGGALRHLQASWRGKLGDVAEPNGIYRGTRFTRIDCKPPFGIDLLSQRDAMLIRSVPRRIVRPDLDDNLLFAREGTILVGGQGTLGEGEIFGRATVVHGQAADVAFTEHLLRVVPRWEQEHALYAYLTTTVGFRLLRSTAVGTKLLSMREDMLRALPVPEWPSDLHKQVSSLVREAFAARVAADGAETEAIRIVEEEVLPQWLG